MVTQTSCALSYFLSPLFIFLKEKTTRPHIYCKSATNSIDLFNGVYWEKRLQNQLFVKIEPISNVRHGVWQSLDNCQLEFLLSYDALFFVKIRSISFLRHRYSCLFNIEVKLIIPKGIYRQAKPSIIFQMCTCGLWRLGLHLARRSLNYSNGERKLTFLQHCSVHVYKLFWLYFMPVYVYLCMYVSNLSVISNRTCRTLIKWLYDFVNSQVTSWRDYLRIDLGQNLAKRNDLSGLHRPESGQRW